MRTIGMAVVGMVVAAPGRHAGCNERSDEGISVSWSIPDGPGERGVTLVGCQDWENTATIGGAVFEPGWSRCALVGWRQDGALRVESDPVELDAGASEARIAFDLPSGPIAGMGARIRGVGAAVHVDDVVPGGPAWAVGIRPGDRILSVDGVSTRGMTSAQFVRAATGSPGSPVSYEVYGEDFPETVVVTRQRIFRDR